MKKNFLSRVAVVFAISSLVVACGDKGGDPNPAITGISSAKTLNIIFGEEITLTANSQGSTFVWQCNGGIITGEGKTVKWTAPNQVGEYSVSVSNGDGSTKSVTLSVVGSYYCLFDSSSSIWSKTSNTTVSFSNGKATVASIADDNYATFGYIVLSQPTLPFSVKTKVAVNTADYLSIGLKPVRFYFYFTDPQTITSDYLKALYFSVAPGQRTWSVATGIKDIAGEVSYSTVRTQSQVDIFTENNQYHTIGIAVTESKTLVINVDGTELYRLDLSSYNCEFKLDRFSYQIFSPLTLLLDDYYQTTDNTILK